MIIRKLKHAYLLSASNLPFFFFLFFILANHLQITLSTSLFQSLLERTLLQGEMKILLNWYFEMCLIADNGRLCFTLLCVFKQVKYAQHGGFEEKNSENCGKLQQTQGNQMQFLVKTVQLLPGLCPKFNAVTAGVCISDLKAESLNCVSEQNCLLLIQWHLQYSPVLWSCVVGN